VTSEQAMVKDDEPLDDFFNPPKTFFICTKKLLSIPANFAYKKKYFYALKWQPMKSSLVVKHFSLCSEI
jgi:hypothetical protein